MALNGSGGGRQINQWMLWAFKLRGCFVCGVRYPEIPLERLHVHHLDPETKRRGRATNVHNRDNGLRTINKHAELLDELVGCEVVCDEHHPSVRVEAGFIAEQRPLFSGDGEAWRY